MCSGCGRGPCLLSGSVHFSSLREWPGRRSPPSSAGDSVIRSPAPWNPEGADAASAWWQICLHSQRSEEHTSELQSLMRISYAVFCLKNKTNTLQDTIHTLIKDQ